MDRNRSQRLAVTVFEYYRTPPVQPPVLCRRPEFAQLAELPSRVQGLPLEKRSPRDSGLAEFSP